MTFAAFLTPEGLLIAAALVTSFVEVVRQGLVDFPPRRVIFVATAVLYVLTGIAVGVPTLDAGLVVFAAWLGCATAAIGIRSTVANGRTALEQTPPNPPG